MYLERKSRLSSAKTSLESRDMGRPSKEMRELIKLIERNTPEDGVHDSGVDGLFTFRGSEPHARTWITYEPGIVFAAQGKKNVYLEGERYDYEPGNFLALFAPLPVECEVTEATDEEPLLGAGLYLDQNKLARLMLKMETFEAPGASNIEIDPSAIFSARLENKMLDAILRLLRTLDSPGEAAILGDAIIDEIYFRLLTNWQGGELIPLLQQRGQIKQISKAVEYVHRNIDKALSVEDMASIVNMSASGFHKKFKEVMHQSPLQYAKSIKLNNAHNYIVDGKNATEAGHLVGYKSPAQFSREYKRHFGVAPSVHK